MSFGSAELDRFFAKVEVGDCWVWTAANVNGYGRFNVKGRALLSHRWLYQTLVRKLRRNEPLDHLCRNHACCNPDHLEPVTDKVNSQRGYIGHWKRPDLCKRGHDPSNWKQNSRQRYCHACNMERQRERRAAA